ncbi:MAG: HAD-IA family hydrolase [Gammaproteobacteria bacterium]|nr:HAD-IA family hydrolase [Gammaproteobacteria bacterium]
MVIFDWDGTLMDSELTIVRGMQGAIREMGTEKRSHEEISNIIGLGLNEAVTALYPGTTPQFAQQMADHYRSQVSGVRQGRESLFPGVIELLEELRERGIRVAVATGKSRRGLNQVLEESGLQNHFHATRCADETQSKPHPQMLLELLESLQVAPEAALMVGDTEYDLEMATRARVASIGVSYGVHSIERLQRHNPIACIAKIDALREFVPPAAPAFVPAE